MSVTALDRAEIAAEVAADVLRAFGMGFANVQEYICKGVDSGLRPESNSLCTPENRDRIAGELLSRLVEPFRRPGETTQEAARRLVAESFGGFSAWTWGRHVQRLGEPLCLLAAVLVAHYRDRFPGVTAMVRNMCGYLHGMLSRLRSEQFLPMVETIVAGLAISRREKKPQPEPAGAAQEPPVAVPEPEIACEPAGAALEPPVAEQPPAEPEPEPEPTSDAQAASEVAPEPPRRLTEDEAENEEYEILRCLRAGETPRRIAMAPPDVQTLWRDQHALWAGLYSNDAKALARSLMHVLHAALERQGLLLPVGWQRR